MMPSARVELWVTYRDKNNIAVKPPAGATAVFRTIGANTGIGGDQWPAVDLAQVHFTAKSAPPTSVIPVRGEAQSLMNPTALSADAYADNAAVGSDATCKPLPAGHRRRIYYNNYESPTSPYGFGLGYEEVDQHGVTVPGTFIDVHPFDPMTPTVCVPLGAGNSPVQEVWELVNLANEQHNFHIHQTKFRIISAAEIDGTGLPTHLNGDGVLVDNIPLHETTGGVCNGVQDWRNGVCTAYPVLVQIPFAFAGDFVYHCHILDHEDAGMMARIRVRAHP
jgi:FtsP/CotA-like multicopper oxidase with cupredoxin domain